MPPKKNGQCSKHDECIGRINDNIKEIQLQNANTTGKIDGFVKSVNEFMIAIRKDIYSKEGIMDRTGNHGMQLSLQWGLMAAIVVGVIVYGVMFGGK